MRPLCIRTFRAGLIVVLLGAAVSCESHPTQPATALVSASVTLSDSIVAPGDMVTVTLTLTSGSDEDAEFVSPHSCLVLPAVYRGDDRMFWSGTDLACLTAVARHVVPARGEVVRVYEIHTPAASGAYPPTRSEPWVHEVRMEMQVRDLPSPSVALFVTPSR